jgi:hypothetical protein
MKKIDARTRISYNDAVAKAAAQGVEFNNIKQGLDWAKANGYKVTDAHNRLDDCDRQVGIKL